MQVQTLIQTPIQTANNSAAFTAAQQQYLQGFFAAVAQRGAIPFVGHTPSGQITNDPASSLTNQADAPEEATYFNTPVSELCKEERWKHQENPLDI